MYILLLLLLSHSLVSDSLPPHGVQHAKIPCPHCLPEFAQTHVHWVDDAIQPAYSVTLFSSCLQSFPASGSSPMSWLLASGSQSIGFSISPSTEYSGLISIRIDWFDLLVVQGTLRNLLQYHNSKATVLQSSAFLMVHLSHLYMTTGKSRVWLFATLWTVASQAPLPLGFPFSRGSSRPRDWTHVS